MYIRRILLLIYIPITSSLSLIDVVNLLFSDRKDITDERSGILRKEIVRFLHCC